MAEEVKRDFPPKEKEEKPAPKADEPTNITGIIILIILFLGFSTTVTTYLVSKSGGEGGGFSWLKLWNYFYSLIPDWLIHFVQQLTITYVLFATVLCLLFIIGIVYAFIRWRTIEDQWQAELYPGPIKEEVTGPRENEKWARIVAHVGSDNPSDWRLSILEADILLDELLDELGYIGDTIGDKLKKAVIGDFKTLNEAWEAHKIRNAIAHEGQDFVLSQRDAQRVIGLYEKVFREFDFI
jgi:hypothetical protein